MERLPIPAAPDPHAFPAFERHPVPIDGAFRPNPSDDRIHFTTLPWVSFTSFSHARNWGREDSIPKIAFGKFVTENQRTFLPFSVEVHHALMDGLHVGRYVSRLEEMLADARIYVESENV